jgi:hypothetical protein
MDGLGYLDAGIWQVSVLREQDTNSDVTSRASPYAILQYGLGIRNRNIRKEWDLRQYLSVRGGDGSQKSGLILPYLRQCSASHWF